MRARELTGTEAICFKAFADAMEVIPTTLAENAGLNSINSAASSIALVLTNRGWRMFSSVISSFTPPLRMLTHRGEHSPAPVGQH
jgi:chaperonin GroEL (HSP60 family)